MKKGYIIGMVAAVLVVTLGIFFASNQGNKSVNSSEVTNKIKDAVKSVNTYYGEIKVTGAVGDKKGVYLVKQWYKQGKLYTENYINTSSGHKTSISLKDNNQSTIYNIDDKNAIITNTTTDKTFVSQDSNFLQFPLSVLEGPISKATSEDNKYIFNINKDDYQYTVKYNSDNLMPIKVDINYKGKFLSSIEFVKLVINQDISDNQFAINIPSNIKILKRSYSNESSDLTKLRTEVKYPILTPSYLPSGIVLDKVTKEMIETEKIVNIYYKGSNSINVIESAVNKNAKKVIPDGLTKVNVGKNPGYLVVNGKITSISWEQGNTAITIYSEINKDTLLKIAGSFK